MQDVCIHLRLPSSHVRVGWQFLLEIGLSKMSQIMQQDGQAYGTIIIELSQAFPSWSNVNPNVNRLRFDQHVSQ